MKASASPLLSPHPIDQSGGSPALPSVKICERPPSFGDAFASEFAQWFAKSLSGANLWAKGFPPGGLLPTAVPKFTSRPAEHQVFLLRNGWDTLDAVRLHGVPVLSDLREFGRKMIQSGVYEHRVRYDDLSMGLKLHSGAQIALPPHLVEALARESRARFYALREWSASLPDPALRLSRPTTGGESLMSLLARPVSGRERLDIYALAYQLGRMTDGQFKVLLRSAPPQRVDKPSFYEAFSYDYCRGFAEFQFHKGWAWRRMLAPGGTSHVDYQSARAKQDLPVATKAFLPLMARGILAYLQSYGAEVVEHLRKVGQKVVDTGHDLENGEFVEPLRGVPLVNGTRSVIDPFILDSLSYEHHLAWLMAREFSWNFPNPTLRQSQAEERPEHHYRWDRSAPDSRWNPDRVHIYGIAVSLALLEAEYPEKYETLLRACRPRLARVD